MAIITRSSLSAESLDHAYNAARAMGGDLATITSQAENDLSWGSSTPTQHQRVDGGLYRRSDAPANGIGTGAPVSKAFRISGTGRAARTASSSTGVRRGEPNNPDTENHLVMEGDGTWNNVPDDHAYAVGYVVEFANYRMNGTYGYAIFNTANGTITYHLDNNDADTQALGAEIMSPTTSRSR